MNSYNLDPDPSCYVWSAEEGEDKALAFCASPQDAAEAWAHAWGRDSPEFRSLATKSGVACFVRCPGGAVLKFFVSGREQFICAAREVPE